MTAAGGKNGSATVTVSARLLSSFNVNTNSKKVAGGPVQFDVGVGSGANLANVHVDFGDSSSTDLGPISAQTSTFHAYCSAGQFNAVASAVDATGAREQLNTNVIIGSLPVILGSSGGTAVDTPITFTASGVTDAQVARYRWTWDDGTGSFDTTAPQTTHTFTTRGLKTVRVDVFGVGCGQIGTATMTLSIS